MSVNTSYPLLPPSQTTYEAREHVPDVHTQQVDNVYSGSRLEANSIIGSLISAIRIEGGSLDGTLSVPVLPRLCSYKRLPKLSYVEDVGFIITTNTFVCAKHALLFL